MVPLRPTTSRRLNALSMGCLSLLRQTIRPEFLNRIDEVIMFTPLSLDNVKQIVTLQFGIVKRMLGEQGLRFQLRLVPPSGFLSKASIPPWGSSC